MRLKELLKSKPPLIWPQKPSNKATEIRKVIQDLEASPLPKLRDAWAHRYGKPVPAPTSRSLLLRLLAWRIQADAFGGHKPEVLQILNEPVVRKGKNAADPPSDMKLRIGTVLKREWHGRQREVVVKADGFAYEGKMYSTLSEAARAITGTKWSGPRFFGLKDSKDRPREIGR
ncbi:MAG: DUF2924 domain-containing protein [Rhodospirillaceae bacterium]|nr:DUF2924 domain-containing protein [Rhodospirillaceae bacterium]